MPVWGATDCGPEQQTKHKGGPPGQHNGRATDRDNTGQNTDKGHTPSPRIEIKIPDAAGNQTRAAGLESKDSTDHATPMDENANMRQKLLINGFSPTFIC